MKIALVRGLNGFVAMASIFVTGGALGGTQVPLAAFKGTQVTEGFEELSVGPNVGSFNNSFYVPGSNAPYDFGSGVTLTAPIPNPGQFAGGVAVGDWNFGFATWGMGSTGFISSAADVPAGVAYLVLNTSAGAVFEFTFDKPQARVGAFVTSSPGTITLEAFDSGGSSLGTATVAAVTLADWGTNFLGFEDLAGIKRVTFSGTFMVMDDLVFEQKASAVTWTEVGDAAHDGIDQAQMTWGIGPLNRIEGTIGAIDDVDLYRIRITDEAIFSVTTVGGAAFNTTLYLFDVEGAGVVFNDDAGVAQSTIDSTLVVSNGVYFLAISSFGSATDAPATRARDENGQPIFSYPSAGQTPPNPCGGALRPDCNPISGRLSFWASGGADTGAYTISLTGADFCAPRCPMTLHVPGSFATIKDAVNASVDGDTVLVAPGIYDETEINFGGKIVAIRSSRGPAHTTITNTGGLRPILDLTPNEGPLTQIEGFTFTMLTAPVQLFTSCMVRDCVFAQNSGSFGGAVSAQLLGTNLIFDRCTFTGNIAADSGGALDIDSGAFARFVNCGFFGNQAISGSGGAIRFFEASGEILGCTFTGNSANSGDALSIAAPAVLQGANNVFWDNPGVSEIVGFDPNIAFTNSLFAGASGSNIDANPNFLDPADGDYRLGAGSPAIDAGDCSLMPPGAEVSDLAGGLRVMNAVSIVDTGPSCAGLGAIDMGCYEASPGTPADCPGDADSNGVVNFSDITEVLSNWLSACP